MIRVGGLVLFHSACVLTFSSSSVSKVSSFGSSLSLNKHPSNLALRGGSAPTNKMAEFWDKRYAEEGWAYGLEPNDFLKEQVLKKFGAGGGKGLKALCLAEGEGRNAIFLAGEGFQVEAVDMAEVGLRKLQALAAEKSLDVKTHVGNLMDFDLSTPGGWDLIVSIFAHTPSEVRSRVHGVVKSSLKSGGTFILEAYTPANCGRGTGGPPTPEMCMSMATLKEELSGLTMDLGHEIEREINEGKYHTSEKGSSAVVQVVGTA